MKKKLLSFILGLPLLLGASQVCNAEEFLFDELQSEMSSSNKNQIIEYHLDWPSGPPGTHDIITNPNKDDELWISGPTHNAIARVKRNGEAKFYPMPANSFPHGLAYDYKGRLWVTLENLGFLVRVNEEGVIQEYIDVRMGNTNTGPHGLSASLDGKFLWFTGKMTSSVGKVDIKRKSVENFSLPTPNAIPIYVVEGNDGKFYCTEFAGNNIAQITQEGQIIEFPVPTANSGPLVIVRSPDRKSLWFSEEKAHQIAQIDFQGNITEFHVPKVQENDLLGALVFDPKQNLWVMSYIDPNNPLPAGGDFLIKINKEIIKARDGNISNIPFTYFQIQGQNSVLHRMTIGPDGNVWFTELSLDDVGKLLLCNSKNQRCPM